MSDSIDSVFGDVSGDIEAGIIDTAEARKRHSEIIDKRDEEIRKQIVSEMRRDFHKVLSGPLKFLRPLF